MTARPTQSGTRAGELRGSVTKEKKQRFEIRELVCKRDKKAIRIKHFQDRRTDIVAYRGVYMQ